MVTGFILDVIFVQTGTMVSVWASQRRRPKKWMIISVWNVKEHRKAAQRNCTASAEHHTMSPSTSCVFFFCCCCCCLLSILHVSYFNMASREVNCKRNQLSLLKMYLLYILNVKRYTSEAEKFVFRFYIGCDRCQNWYHGRCVGILQSEATHIDEYVCPQCQSTEEAMTVLSPLTDKDYEGLKRILRSLQVILASWNKFKPVL